MSKKVNNGVIKEISDDPWKCCLCSFHRLEMCRKCAMEICLRESKSRRLKLNHTAGKWCEKSKPGGETLKRCGKCVLLSPLRSFIRKKKPKSSSLRQFPKEIINLSQSFGLGDDVIEWHVTQESSFWLCKAAVTSYFREKLHRHLTWSNPSSWISAPGVCEQGCRGTLVLSAVTDDSIIQQLGNFCVLGGLIINPDLHIDLSQKPSIQGWADVANPVSRNSDNNYAMSWPPSFFPHPQFTEKCHPSPPLAQHSVRSSKPQYA